MSDRKQIGKIVENQNSVSLEKVHKKVDAVRISILVVSIILLAVGVTILLVKYFAK